MSQDDREEYFHIMADVYKKHRSHISGKRSKARGWNKVPPHSVRAETYNLIEEANSAFMSGNYASFTISNAVEGNLIGSTYDGDSYTSDSSTRYVTWLENWSYLGGIIPNIKEGGEKGLREQFNELEKLIKSEKGVIEMTQRTLFRVYVIDPRKGGTVLMDGQPVIADNDSQAMLKAGVAAVADKVGLELEQVDVYVEEIATFIRPRRETQKVKVVTTDEDD